MREFCFFLVLGLFGWANCSQGTVTSFQLVLDKILILIFKQDVVARNVHALKEGVSRLLRNVIMSVIVQIAVMNLIGVSLSLKIMYSLKLTNVSTNTK